MARVNVHPPSLTPRPNKRAGYIIHFFTPTFSGDELVAETYEEAVAKCEQWLKSKPMPDGACYFIGKIEAMVKSEVAVKVERKETP